MVLDPKFDKNPSVYEYFPAITICPNSMHSLHKLKKRGLGKLCYGKIYICHVCYLCAQTIVNKNGEYNFMDWVLCFSVDCKINLYDDERNSDKYGSVADL